MDIGRQFASGSETESKDLVKSTTTEHVSTGTVRYAEPDDSEERAKGYGYAYFDNYQGTGFYWDYPHHEITARHVLSRRPESVLELGCGRGYILKRLQDSKFAGLVHGMDISKHCWMTRVCQGFVLGDVCKTPWDIHVDWDYGRREYEPKYDLCLSLSFLEHVPERYLPAVLGEIGRVCRRGLHGITFAGEETLPDPARRTLKPREWWKHQFDAYGLHDHELLPIHELESGPLPEDYVRGDGRVKLNVGSAWTMFHHGWQNLDAIDAVGFAQQHRYRFGRVDARAGLPCKTQSADLVYCAHMLEHLTYAEGLAFLRDCRRILKPSGAMRLLVPDAESLMRSYGDRMCWDTLTGDNDLQSPHDLADFDHVNANCAAARTAAGKLWALLHEGHASCYDAETLCKVLGDAGFDSASAPFRGLAEGLGDRNAASRRQILQETLDSLPSLSLFVDAVPRVG